MPRPGMPAEILQALFCEQKRYKVFRKYAPHSIDVSPFQLAKILIVKCFNNVTINAAMPA